MQHESIISSEDLKILTNSKSKLENIGYIMQGLNFVGDGIEKATKLIPARIERYIGKKTNSILMGIIKANLKTMSKNKMNSAPLNKTYKGVVTASGVGFGLVGYVGFLFDLPITTKLMMRSILDIARSNGEDLNKIETQLACLEVFALGGKSKNDDGLETSYYVTRFALAGAINSASKFVTENGVKIAIEKFATGTPMMQLIAKIATRYEVAVLEKLAAEGIPIFGAIGGGTINLVFMNHFQKMAEAHFSIRQLERKYGEEIVRLKYNEIKITA
jgi:preprotein translocase subunit Sss1